MSQTPSRHNKKGESTGDLEACASWSRKCGGTCAARGWQGATCWLSAERTSLVGGTWAFPLQSCREATGRERPTRKPRRRACSGEQRLLHVVRRCRPCATYPATNRRAPCRLAALVVAAGGGMTIPPLRCYPRGNRGFGLDEKQKKCTWYKTKKKGRDSRSTAAKASSSQDDAIS